MSVDFCMLATTTIVNRDEGDVDTAESPITIVVHQVEPEHVLRHEQSRTKARDHDLAQGGEVVGPKLDAGTVNGSQRGMAFTVLEVTFCPRAIDCFTHADRVEVVARPVVSAADRRRVPSHPQAAQPRRTAGGLRAPLLPMLVPLPPPPLQGTVGDRHASARPTATSLEPR